MVVLTAMANVVREVSDLALQDFNRAISLNPSLAPAYNNRGNLLYDRGEIEKALADYTRSIELNPENPLAYANRGLTLLSLGRAEEAARDFARCFALDPRMAEKLNHLIRRP